MQFALVANICVVGEGDLPTAVPAAISYCNNYTLIDRMFHRTHSTFDKYYSCYLYSGTAYTEYEKESWRSNVVINPKILYLPNDYVSNNCGLDQLIDP